MALRELAEEREIGEAQQLRYLFDGEVRTAQILLYRLHRVAVYPVERRAPRHLLCDVREILRRDAQFLRIFLHGLHPAVVRRQHLDEALEKQVGLLEIAPFDAILHVGRDDGEQLVDGTLQQAVHNLLMIETMRILYLVCNDGVVLQEHLLAFLVEVDHGVVRYVTEQIKIVAVHLHTGLGCLARHADTFRVVVGRYHHVFPCAVWQTDNHVARLCRICVGVGFKLYTSLSAVDHHNHIKLERAVYLQHLVDAVEHNHVAIYVVGIATVSDKSHVNLQFCHFVSHYVS